MTSVIFVEFLTIIGIYLLTKQCLKDGNYKKYIFIIPYFVMFALSWLAVHLGLMLWVMGYEFGAWLEIRNLDCAAIGGVMIAAFAVQLYFKKRARFFYTILGILFVVLIYLLITNSDLGGVTEIQGLNFPATDNTLWIAILFFPFVVGHLFLFIGALREYLKTRRKADFYLMLTGAISLLPAVLAQALIHFQNMLFIPLDVVVLALYFVFLILGVISKFSKDKDLIAKPSNIIHRDLLLKLQIIALVVISFSVFSMALIFSVVYVGLDQRNKLDDKVGSEKLQETSQIEKVGYYQVKSKEAYEKETAYLASVMTEIALFILLICMVIVSIYLKKFIRPIKQMGETAKKINKGDYSIKLKSNRIDELGKTIKAFTNMSKSIGKQTRQLKEKVREQRDFLNYVVHELKTPVSSTRWALEILQDADNRLDLKQKDMIKAALETNKNMKKLIDDLLEFSRFERGAIEVEIKKVKIEDAIKYILSELREMTMRQGIKLVWKKNKIKLPAVKSDQKRLIQVLNNIVGNAIKYSLKGGNVVISTSVVKNSGPRKSRRGKFVLLG